MSNVLVVLDNLATDINREHELAEQAARTAVEHAMKAGELLTEAKATVAHGEWLPWLKTNVVFSERTAQAYMRIAREVPKLNGSKAQRVADLPFRDAMDRISRTYQMISKAQDAGIDLDVIAQDSDGGATPLRALHNASARARYHSNPPT